MLTPKKAQVVIYSIMFFIVVFFLIIIVFSDYLFSHPRINQVEYRVMEREAVRAADALVSSGIPRDWFLMNDVQRLGLVDDGVLNLEKFYAFQNNISHSSNGAKGYARSRGILGVQHDYLILCNSSSFNRSLTGPGLTTSLAAVSSLDNSFITVQDRFVLINTTALNHPTPRFEQLRVKVVIYR